MACDVHRMKCGYYVVLITASRRYFLIYFRINQKISDKITTVILKQCHYQFGILSVIVKGF